MSAYIFLNLFHDSTGAIISVIGNCVCGHQCAYNDFINLKHLLTQSLEGAHMSRVRTCVYKSEHVCVY